MAIIALRLVSTPSGCSRTGCCAPTELDIQQDDLCWRKYDQKAYYHSECYTCKKLCHMQMKSLETAALKVSVKTGSTASNGK